MIDLTFVRMANEPIRERKEREHVYKLKDLLFDVFASIFLGIAICIFLLVIYSI